MIKKALYSHWSKPNENTDLYAGFNTEQDFANAMHLSVLCSKKWFEEVELVTDKEGKEFVNRHKIPFDNIIVCLDDYNHIRAKHWAIGKIVACNMQKAPFMHIDNDVFLFKKPEKNLLDSDASFQNYERVEQYWYTNQLEIAKKECPIKEIDYNVEMSLNCGIMGFNKLDVLSEWMELALQYIDWFDNTESIKKELSSIMFEQYHIFQLLKKYNYNIAVIENFYISPKIAKEKGYTHLISGSKRRPDLEEKVENRLAQELAT